MTTPESPAAQNPGDTPGQTQTGQSSGGASQTPAEPVRPRLSLPKLERSGPTRLVTTVGRFDDAPANDAGKSPAPGRPLVSGRDVIEHGIRVAQEVIDQQMGSGERILRHLRKAPIRKRRISALDAEAAGTLTDRTLLLYKELGVLTLELLETLIHTPTVVQVLARWLGLGSSTAPPPSPPASPVYPGAPPTPPAPQCTVQISSRKFASARIDWHAGVTLDQPYVTALTRREAPPIENVSFHADTRAFRIAIHDDQPPGAYGGAIVNECTGSPLGTIIVTIAG
jgi:hypothetical protein